MARITKSVQKKRQNRYDAMVKTFSEVAEKHNLKDEVVIDVFKQAVRNVYARSKGGDDVHVEVVFNEELLDFEARLLKVVVASDDDVEDDALEIGLEEAKELDNDAEVDGKVVFERAFLNDFKEKTSNHVAQNFRHQLIELEKEQLFNLFKDKIGELVKGVVEKNERTTYINLLGITSVFFDERGKQAIPGEVFKAGQEVNFYIVDVVSGLKGANIIISRSHPNFVKRLMEREVHEIYDGTIIIHNIVREEGERVKVAVESLDPNVDPVGSCIGPNASRIQKITAELGPDGRKEKIDIIPFEKNEALYILEAFRPAVPLGINIDTEKKTAQVIFDVEEKGKAFGHKGANIRLSAKLTGYNLTIVDTQEAMEQELTFQTKADIEYEARLLEQEKARERLMRELARSEEVAQQAAAQKQLLDEEMDALDTDNFVYKDNEVEAEEIPAPAPVKAPEVPVEPVIQAVKTTISLADLEAELLKEKEAELEREKALARREERKAARGKPDSRPEPKVEPVIEPVVSGPKMDIYTEEELAELEKETHVVEEDDIDYDDFDEYYNE